MPQRCWPIITLLILLALAAPARVFAHPEIVSTEPAADAQLTSAPTVVRIFFNEEIEAAFSEIQLFDTQRQRVDNGGSGRAPGDPTVLELPLPALKPGLYTVVWQTIGSDGHKVVGNFVFTVLGSSATAAPANHPAAVAATPPPAAPAPQIAGESAESERVLPILAALLRALMLLGALSAIGGWVIGARVLYRSIPSHARPARVVAIRRWRLAEWVSLIVLLLATIGFTIVHTLALAGNTDIASLRTVLFDTRLGQALAARLLLTLLLIACLAISSRERIRFGISIWLLGGALLLTFSLSGHAAAQPDPFLPVLADWLHLTATSVWIGGLILLVLALPAALRALSEKDRVNVSARLIERFSTYTLISVLALTASGTYAALLHLTTLSDLWTSGYGRALLLKVGLFGVLLLIGAYNMLVVRPRFSAWARRAAETIVLSRWQQRFQWAMRAEVVLALVLIGAVGFLTNAPPPSVQARRPADRASAAPSAQPAQPLVVTPRPTRTPVPSVPFEQTKTIQDLQIGLGIAPASIGENRVRVSLRDANGAPEDIQKVLLSFEMLEMDMGLTEMEAQPQGDGTYIAEKGWLSMVGEWRVRVTVRRSDADDIETEFTVPVGG
jgi:copper transport protein